MAISLISTNTTWALIHEGIHSNLSNNPIKNNFYSRILALTIQCNFEVLKFGHLQHHRHNRSDTDLTEAYTKKNNKIINFINYIYKSIAYYSYITFGLYTIEILVPFLFLLPKKVILNIAIFLLGKNHNFIKSSKLILENSKKLLNIRIDCIFNLLFFALILYLYNYRTNAIVVYLLFISIRALIISSSDNLPHYGAKIDKIDGAYNLKSGAIWQKMILNFNYHRTHHRHPHVPWHKLPECFTQDDDHFDKIYYKQYLKQWRGIINKRELL